MRNCKTIHSYCWFSSLRLIPVVIAYRNALPYSVLLQSLSNCSEILHSLEADLSRYNVIIQSRSEGDVVFLGGVQEV